MFNRAQFAAAFRSLLPRGVIWRRDTGSVQGAVLDGLAASYERSSTRATDLLGDAMPVQPVELLAEWEQTLGLPDPCIGPQETLAQRQAQVRTRFRAAGGQTPAYYTQIAAEIGFPNCTVTEFTESIVVDIGTVEQPLNSGAAWANTWRLNIPTNLAIVEFAAGQSVAGEPLRAWGDGGLVCVIDRIRPAHTDVIYAFP